MKRIVPFMVIVLVVFASCSNPVQPTTPSAENIGLFSLKYLSAQAGDVQYSYSTFSGTFSASYSGMPYKSSGIGKASTRMTTADWGTSRYVSFVDSGVVNEITDSTVKSYIADRLPTGTDSSKARVVKVNLYESNGTLVSTVWNYAVLYYFGAKGFLCVGYDACLGGGNGTFFSTTDANFAATGSVSYTPTALVVTDLSTLTSYTK